MFSDDPADKLRIYEFVSDCVADGWQSKPTYKNEPPENAATLTKDGFTIQVIVRDTSGIYKYEAHMMGWGPDGLTIKLPHKYDMEAMRADLTHCHVCGTRGVATERYSFAGRCCAACRPEMARITEPSGWAE